MKFTNSKPRMTPQEIANAEAAVDVRLPKAVRDLYLSANGGSPEPYVFENENVDTVISEFLPLSSNAEALL